MPRVDGRELVESNDDGEIDHHLAELNIHLYQQVGHQLFISSNVAIIVSL